MKLSNFLSILIVLAILPINAFAVPVVSSIKPIDSLVKMIISNPRGAGLIIDDNKSPHGFSMKPSDAKKINDADIIFYIDDSFEAFLSKALKNNKKIVKVPLLQKGDMRLYGARTSRKWESKKVDKTNKNVDRHIWLDTQNAKEMLRIIKTELSILYPNNKSNYEANYQKAIVQINILHEVIKDRLKRFKDKRFMVYHDAFHYFENQFYLNNIGSINNNPYFNVSIKSLKQNRMKARNDDVKCVFYEPQFNQKFSNIVAKSTTAKVVKIDPMGFDLRPSRDLYASLMKNATKAFEECFS